MTIETVVEVTVTLEPTVQVVCPGCGRASATNRGKWLKAQSGAIRWPKVAEQLGIHCHECDEFGQISGWKLKANQGTA